ncbi:MAG: hypothetical protein GSR83_04005 [Desulfurococcales archaeon]|nr:hypothetical protein [Desulfurococcales archaeon]
MEKRKVYGGITYISLIALLSLNAFTALPIYAVTEYIPRWTDRPVASGVSGVYTVGSIPAVTSLGSTLYAVGNYLNSTNDHTAFVIYSYTSTGSIQNYFFGYSDTGDVRGNDVAASPSNVYVFGYYGSSGIIVAFDIGLTHYTSYTIVNPPSSSYTISFLGGCVDGDSNVYTVGVEWNMTQSPAKSVMIFEGYTPDLSTRKFSTTISTSQYNLTGWACTVGPDGYVYAVASTSIYYNGNNFPVHLLVFKLSPVNGLFTTYRTIQLYTSQGWVTSYSYQPADIKSDGDKLLVTFTYSDEAVAPDEPTAGASVMAMDTNLNILWRTNISTTSHERFDSIAVGSAGDFAAGGSTNNSYGTGLSGSYFNGFLVVFDSKHNVVKAILSGDTQGSHGTLVYDVANDGEGYIYWSGFAGNDDEYTAYYDVTSEVQEGVSSVKPGLEPPSYKQLSLPVAGNTRVKPVVPFLEAEPSNTVGYNTVGGGLIILKNYRNAGIPVKPRIAPESTPGGNSEGIIVATAEQISPPISPPQPVPESGYIVALTALAASVVVIYWRAGRLG